MKFGVNTFIWSARFTASSLHLLDLIKQAGFDGVELPLIYPGDLMDSHVRQAIADSGLSCTFCAVLPSDLSCISDDENVRSRTRFYLQQSIEVAAQFGPTVLGGPLYAPVGFLSGRRRTIDEWQRGVEIWRSLEACIAAADVEIAIEPLNRFETFFLNTISDSVAFCEAIQNPRIGVLLDTFHANIEEKNIANACRDAGPRLKHVHVCENDRGIPGTGHIAWTDLLSALRDLHYDRWLTIESFGFSLPELSAAAAIWRDLAPSPESIAFEGLRFLKQHSV